MAMALLDAASMRSPILLALVGEFKGNCRVVGVVLGVMIGVVPELG